MADNKSAHVRQLDGEQTEFTVLLPYGEQFNNQSDEEKSCIYHPKQS
jgi:hypothetical protein